MSAYIYKTTTFNGLEKYKGLFDLVGQGQPQTDWFEKMEKLRRFE